MRPRPKRWKRFAPPISSIVKPGQQRYSQFLNASGGILDDFMVTRLPDANYDGTLYLVVNAACKDADYQHIAAHLPANVSLAPKSFALLALQGPEAVDVMDAHAPGSSAMPFMTSRTTRFDDIWVQLSRSGYTGEDGFEISAKPDDAVRLWEILLADQSRQAHWFGRSRFSPP